MLFDELSAAEKRSGLRDARRQLFLAASPAFADGRRRRLVIQRHSSTALDLNCPASDRSNHERGGGYDDDFEATNIAPVTVSIVT